jgi:hypothetical protein
MDGVLTKPVDLATLASAVAQFAPQPLPRKEPEVRS